MIAIIAEVLSVLGCKVLINRSACTFKALKRYGARMYTCVNVSCYCYHSIYDWWNSTEPWSSNHSTMSALILTLDNIYHAIDLGKSTILVSLDLSAAFDTINHSILLDHLQTSFGLTCTVLQWISSYLSNRSQYVQLGQYKSPISPCTCGVPQGSVLGLILFT